MLKVRTQGAILPLHAECRYRLSLAGWTGQDYFALSLLVSPKASASTFQASQNDFSLLLTIVIPQE
ncbi:hypothetical protein FKO01_06090 [Mesorhizobium sp. B2-3-3]|nr:hypothetical protein FKO01_06090 [Mesorhizobium sp. B2-3-3]